MWIWRMLELQAAATSQVVGFQRLGRRPSSKSPAKATEDMEVLNRRESGVTVSHPAALRHAGLITIWLPDPSVNITTPMARGPWRALSHQEGSSYGHRGLAFDGSCGQFGLRDGHAWVGRAVTTAISPARSCLTAGFTAFRHRLMCCFSALPESLRTPLGAPGMTPAMPS
jgi:hypothetical protein